MLLGCSAVIYRVSGLGSDGGTFAVQPCFDVFMRKQTPTIYPQAWPSASENAGTNQRRDCVRCHWSAALRLTGRVSSIVTSHPIRCNIAFHARQRLILYKRLMIVRIALTRGSRRENRIVRSCMDRKCYLCSVRRPLRLVVQNLIAQTTAVLLSRYHAGASTSF